MSKGWERINGGQNPEYGLFDSQPDPFSLRGGATKGGEEGGGRGRERGLIGNLQWVDVFLAVAVIHQFVTVEAQDRPAWNLDRIWTF